MPKIQTKKAVIKFIAKKDSVILNSPMFQTLEFIHIKGNEYKVEINRDYEIMIINQITRNGGIIIVEKNKQLFFHKCELDPIQELFAEYCITDKITLEGNFCKVEISGDCLSVEILLQKNGFEPVEKEPS